MCRTGLPIGRKLAPAVRDLPGLLPGIGFADRRSGSRSAKDFFARTLEAGDGMGGESWRGG
jgi:hypothetical protein